MINFLDEVSNGQDVWKQIVAEENAPTFTITPTRPKAIIQIKYRPGAEHLQMTDTGDWCDLKTYEDVELQAGDFAIIPLGVCMKLPQGYEANIVPRSSTFKRWGLLQTNHFAVIDESYCGNDDEWGYPVLATRDVFIPAGTRLCQFRINEKQPELIFQEVDDLLDVSRGGWGSSGV